mmetsp:Transcript_5130/g.9325  ORF Transcript_5130/g.9325 Transcript_5130/m.9325 type:complete len:183 (-) Transcript_5130:179-727(-)
MSCCSYSGIYCKTITQSFFSSRATQNIFENIRSHNQYNTNNMATINHHLVQPEHDAEEDNTTTDNIAAEVALELVASEVVPAAIELQMEMYSAIAGEAKELISRTMDGASKSVDPASADVVNPDSGGTTDAIAQHAASDAVNPSAAEAVGSAGGDIAANAAANPGVDVDCGSVDCVCDCIIC